MSALQNITMYFENIYIVVISINNNDITYIIELHNKSSIYKQVKLIDYKAYSPVIMKISCRPMDIKYSRHN